MFPLPKDAEADSMATDDAGTPLDAMKFEIEALQAKNWRLVDAREGFQVFSNVAC